MTMMILLVEADIKCSLETISTVECGTEDTSNSDDKDFKQGRGLKHLKDW